jgi:hypothetical protein
VNPRRVRLVRGIGREYSAGLIPFGRSGACAVFEAGATAVVGTLGPVRDSDAESFFRDFYDSLGAPPPGWSRFILVGNGAVTPREAPARLWVWLVCLLAGLVGGGFVLRGRSFWSRG